MPLPPSLSPLVTTSSLCLWVCFYFVIFICLFYFLDSTCKWKHTVFAFLCLIYFIKYNTLQVKPCCCKWQNFILFFNDWVIFQWVIFSYIYEKAMISIYIFHIFFIHASVDRHLHSFHILATVNNAVMNIRVHMSFWIRFFCFLLEFSRWTMLCSLPQFPPCPFTLLDYLLYPGRSKY